MRSTKGKNKKESKEQFAESNVAVVAFPWPSVPPYRFLTEALTILERICTHIIFIGGNIERIPLKSHKIEFIDIGISMHHNQKSSIVSKSSILWLWKCIKSQMSTAVQLLRIRRRIGTVIFYMIYPYDIPVLLAAKISGKRTIEIVNRGKSSHLYLARRMHDRLSLRLFDVIAPQSESLVTQLKLEEFSYKIIPLGARYVDTACFKMSKLQGARETLIGYIGRLEDGKGLKELIESIPLIDQHVRDAKFIIAGNGNLFPYVKLSCEQIRKKYDSTILVPGFIEPAEVARYLNEMKIFILPSQSEGLPTVILEAMACGAIILTTSVGAVRDIVRDGVTGFIMETNSPECIAKNVIRILELQDIETIARNANEIIQRRYSFDDAISRWEQIIKY